MARRRRDDGRNEPQAPAPPPRSGIDTVGLATLGGIIAVLMISFANMRSIDRVYGDLDDRLDEIEDKIGQAPAATAARTGPRQSLRDPDGERPSQGPGRRADRDRRILGLPVTVLREGRSDPQAG